MRLLGCIFSLFVFFYPHATMAQQKFFVVLDLDWTLINPINLENQKPDFINANESFRIMPHVVESLYRLATEGIEVIIMSGGSARRNAAAVSEIYRRVNEVARLDSSGHQITPPDPIRPFQVLSIENMTPDSQGSPEMSYRFRFDKNILAPKDAPEKVSHLPEDRIMALDDIPEFAPVGLEHLFLIVGDNTNNYDRFTDSASDRAKKAPHAPLTSHSWALDRARVAYASQVFILAVRAARKSGLPFWAEVLKIVGDSRKLAKLGITLTDLKKTDLAAVQEARKFHRQTQLMLAGVAAANALKRLSRKGAFCETIF